MFPLIFLFCFSSAIANELTNYNSTNYEFNNHALIDHDNDLESVIKSLDEDPTKFKIINELSHDQSDLAGKSDPNHDTNPNTNSRKTCFNDHCYPPLIVTREGRELVLVPPDSPEDINVTFHILQSRNGPSTPNEILITSFNYNTTSDELRKLPLHSCKKTIFLIHGWLDNITIARFWWEPIVRMTEKYSKNNLRMSGKYSGNEMGGRGSDHRKSCDDYQVIFVDWSGGSSSSYYLPAVSNSRVVSSALADLITTLVDDHGFDPMDMHLIGFSLGAHVAGFVGKMLPSNYLNYLIKLTS